MPKAMYSLEEVARNDGQFGSRTWIAIKDSVYDVTDYLAQVNINFLVISGDY